MNNINKILAFGDSHVAGCELSSSSTLDDYLQGKISLEQADAPGKLLAFPQKLADMLDVPCENYALTGGSNDRSLRKLTETIEENCLVIFGYTSPDRKEFYYPDEGLFLGRDDDNFIQTGVQWTGAIENARKSSPMTHPINNQYLHILRHYDNINNVFTTVDSICKAYNSKVIHIAVADIDHSMFNYLDWCKDNNYKQLPYLHYEEQAHTDLAELLWKNIGDII